MKTDQRLAHAVSTFQSLGLADWVLANPGHQVGQGGQSGVCVVRQPKSGMQGVFRCLPPPESMESNKYAKLVSRFQKELRALQQVSSPNVMALLASGVDAPYWYISERGIGLKEHWQAFLSNEPSDDVAARTALRLVLDLAKGLAECHKIGVVHRDIKPNNIVVYLNGAFVRPVLIDFGVAWIEGDAEERITELDEAVGNAQYGPDILRRRAEDCPPWLDVFSLSQVLLFLTAERDVKHYWQRPVSWRYAAFSKKVSAELCDSIRAIAAVASIEDLSPKNGDELCSLINALVSVAGASNGHSDLSVAIEETIRTNSAIPKLRKAREVEEYLASRLVAGQFVIRFAESFHWLKGQTRTFCTKAKEFDALFAEDDLPPNQPVEVAVYKCGIKDQVCFELSMEVRFLGPSNWKDPDKERPAIITDANPFFIYITRKCHLQLPHNEQFEFATHAFSIERNGVILLRDARDLRPVSQVSWSDVSAIVSEMYGNLKAWEQLARC